MIRDITEVRLPEGITLSQASCRVPNMDESTITATIKVGRDNAIDSTQDWVVVWRGVKYIMPIRKPQGTKGNTEVKTNTEVTFRHWASYELQRWMFHTVASEGTTLAVEKYVADVRLNLKDFCTLFGQVLNHYYGDKITIDLNPDYDGGKEVVGLSISYTIIWDVLKTLFENYGAGWSIEPRADNDNYTENGERYVIKVGYEGAEIDHIFEYGHEGGIQEVSRQIQSEKIRNMLLGRGGDTNIPFRYFKDIDPNNPQFRADPDWVEELKYIYFDRLRGATFRSYIQGWKAQHSYLYTGYKPVGENNAYASWAYQKGYTDTKFDPVEYVKDDESIANYGELLGHIDDNDEIYPTIQGTGHDVAIAVEQIQSDDIEESTEAEAEIANAPEVFTTTDCEAHERVDITISAVRFSLADFIAGVSLPNLYFEVKEEMTANLMLNPARIRFGRATNIGGGATIFFLDDNNEKGDIEIENATLHVYDMEGNEHSPIGLTAGKYRYEVTATVHNKLDVKCRIEVSYAPTIESAKIDKKNWANTFNVWVDNIWSSQKKSSETTEEYSRRVWQPILGDKEGNKAIVQFTTGDLAISEDYEFIIVDYPTFDDSKSYDGVTSHWCLRLAKSDAEFENTGVYIPSVNRQGMAGDRFVFLGIDMPHDYTLWAEETLDDAKKIKLDEVKDVKSSLSVKLDRIRINKGTDNLLSQLIPGNTVKVLDSQLITTTNNRGEVIPSSAESRVIQSVTINYRTPTEKDAALNPDIEIELADKFETGSDLFGSIDAEISALQKQVGSLSNISKLVRAIGDKLYLRKDGIADKSLSPTEFASLLTVGKFNRGLIGGSGVGIYKDANGSWIIESDRLNVRQDMQVNNLVVNQAEARGGMMIDTAAYLEISNVVESADGYTCYFNTHSGTIANLFKVDDVAYCQRWTPENATLKYYKRRVLAIGTDSVTLSKSEVDGTGIPAGGDVIIHYGNYTDKERQYVKVRDVVGGGYERYIEGLDSVSAQGDEFFFVGKHTGENARWFVGDKNGANIEFKNDELSLNQVKLSVTSRVGNQPIDEFVSDKVSNTQIGGANMILNSDVEQKDYVVYYHTSEPIKSGNTYTLTLWTSHPYQTLNIGIGESVSEQFITTQATMDGKCRCTFTVRQDYEGNEINTKTISIWHNSPVMVTIQKAKLEIGQVSTDWTPNQEEILKPVAYLERALKESTTIDGGLIATSLIQLGYTIDDNFVVQSGINGLSDPTRKGNGVAFWAGGDMVDAEETEDGTPAKFLVRHDGTGYMTQMQLGKNLRLSEDELIMVTGENGKSFTIKAGATGYKNLESAETPEQTYPIIQTVQAEQWLLQPSAGSTIWATAMFNSVTQKVEDVLKGGSIRVNLALEWSYPIVGTNPNIPDAWGYVTVELLHNGVVVDTFVNSATGQARFNWANASSATINGTRYAKYACNAVSESIVFTEAGDYELRFTSHADSAVEPIRVDDINLTQNITTSVSESGVYQTIIGTDGFASHWGESLVAVSEQGAILRFGDKYLKVSAEGIAYNNGNGEQKLI